MQIFDTPNAMRAWSQAQQVAGLSVGLVPTMGFLHAGHLSLIAEATKRVKVTVVSIFVNPVQFGPHEDFDAYPRDIERDLALCREAGVDAVFLPQVTSMYASDASVLISENRLSQGFCGAQRPGHFRGVCTVVAKLFNIVLPQIAVFGQKDFQQVAVIRRMVRDLNFPLEVVVAPIVRESDGLAMSSRNVYLSKEERQQALGLIRALQAASDAVGIGVCDVGEVRRRMTDVLQQHQLVIDYAELANAETLEPVMQVQKGHVALLAVRCGKTRLIDNRVL